MKNVRAKLVCTNIRPWDDGATADPQKVGEVVTFEARYNGEDTPEDNNFSKYTPSASMDMSITNPELFNHFQVDKAYYFDISEAVPEN